MRPASGKRTFCFGTPWNNAVGRHFRGLASELANRGHRVFMLIWQRRGDEALPYANPGVLVWPSVRPTTWRDAKWFGDFIRQERPSVSVSNFGSSNIMLAMGAFLHVPIRVQWHHTMHGQLSMDSSFGTWRRRMLVTRKRLVYRLATHFVTGSGAARSDLVAVYGVNPDMTAVLGFGMADPGVRSAPVSSWDLVCVGRMHISKGQDVLLRAFANLPPLSRLTLIGDGPARPAYERLARELGIADRCRFTGAIPLDEVPHRMAKAAVCVVPSREEAFGLVNVESMAVGTPVVASRVGGIPEIVRDGSEGFLVPPDDPEALAAALGRVLSDPQLRQALADKARRRFEKQFADSAVIPRQADWFEAL